MTESMIQGLFAEIDELRRLINDAYADEKAKTVWLTTPLTSTSWDGDARSTTAKTVIDLSAVFGVPANAKAVNVRLLARDSGSAGMVTVRFGLAPNSTANSIALSCWPGGKTNDAYDENSGWVPCDANGDIYFQCVASGAGTLDVILEIWGYET